MDPGDIAVIAVTVVLGVASTAYGIWRQRAAAALDVTLRQILQSNLRAAFFIPECPHPGDPPLTAARLQEACRRIAAGREAQCEPFERLSHWFGATIARVDRFDLRPGEGGSAWLHRLDLGRDWQGPPVSPEALTELLEGVRQGQRPEDCSLLEAGVRAWRIATITLG